MEEKFDKWVGEVERYAWTLGRSVGRYVRMYRSSLVHMVLGT